MNIFKEQGPKLQKANSCCAEPIIDKIGRSGVFALKKHADIKRFRSSTSIYLILNFFNILQVREHINTFLVSRNNRTMQMCENIVNRKNILLNTVEFSVKIKQTNFSKNTCMSKQG